MSHQCPFPVRASDTRRCYRTGSVPGFTLSLTLVAILSGYAGLADAAPAVKEIPAPTEMFAGYGKGRLLAAPRAGLSEKELAKAMKQVNAKSKGRFTQNNIHVLELPPGLDEVKAMNIMKKNKAWKFVELDMAVMPAATVSDPNYSNSWALPKIQAPTAWDTANGSGVVIAILDTGVDGNHPDLKPNLVPGWNIFNNNSDTSDPHGHGTWVSGAAGMAANNGTGSAGVAWGAKIMPVRIADANAYAYWSTVAQGINWAADKGAKVANVSYNGVSGSSTVQSAANYMRSKGGVVVVAGGNSGGLENISANDALLSVAATDSNDAKASFSSYGNYIDLAAPGVSIYTTTVGGGYSNANGTSFASPIVAATAALMMSANSKLTPGDIDKIFKSTSIDLGTAGFDQYFGYGRIDAAKAVAAAKSTSTTTTTADTQAPTISIASPTAGSVSGVVAVDVKYSDNVGVTRVELYVNGNKLATDDTSPFAFSWDTAGYADGSYNLVAKAYDAAGNAGTSASVSVTLGNDTTPPVITSFSAASTQTVSVPKQTISASATDDNRVAKLSLNIDGKDVATTTGSSISYSWNTRKVSSGAHTITVRAWDAAGNTTSQSVSVYRK
jgi:thermitase